MMYVFLAVVIIIADRITKLFALTHCMQEVVVNRFLSFQTACNRGISWSMFHSSSTLQFVVVSTIVALATLVLGWYTYCQYKRGNSILCEVVILAGAVGNLIDRVLYGGVVDFIAIGYGNYTFPLFNIADIAIVGGTAALLFMGTRQSKNCCGRCHL